MVSEKEWKINTSTILLVACVAAVFGVLTGVFTAATNRVLAYLPVWVAGIILIVAFAAIIYCILYVAGNVPLLEKKKAKK